MSVRSGRRPRKLIALLVGAVAFFSLAGTSHAVTVTFSIENPVYGVIDFSDPTPSVQWAQTIAFTTSLVGGTDWHWYVNNDDTGVTAATLVWDTSTVLPGQYIINVDALYGGYPCTGSVLATVYN